MGTVFSGGVQAAPLRFYLAVFYSPIVSLNFIPH
jgi:hypothetical protein